MNTAGIQAGDIIRVTKCGWEFYAVVDSLDAGMVQFTPLEKRITWRTASAREINAHWSKRGRKRTPQAHKVQAVRSHV